MFNTFLIMAAQWPERTWWIFRAWDSYTCFASSDSDACMGQPLFDPSGEGPLWMVIGNIAYDLLVLASIITTFVMVAGAIMYVTSGGSPDKVAKATKTITGSLVGAVISVSAAVIVGFVMSQVADDNIGGTVNNIMSTLYYLVGAISIIMIIYSGLSYMIAAGDEAKMKKAKQTLVYAVVGLVLAIAAGAITTFVIQGVVG